MNIILGLCGALGVALLAILGLKNKNAILTLLDKNKDVIAEVQKLSTEAKVNDGDIKVEEQVRSDLQTNIDAIKEQKDSQEQILSYFNQGPKKK